MKLSLRLPPNEEAAKGAEQLEKVLTLEPLYNSKVTFTADKFASGWCAPPTADWLSNALQDASKKYYGKVISFLFSYVF